MGADRIRRTPLSAAQALADVATVELDAAKAVQGAHVVVTMVWDADSVMDVVRAAVPGLSAEEFATFAEEAKKNCPVSAALTGTTITLDAALA